MDPLVNHESLVCQPGKGAGDKQKIHGIIDTLRTQGSDKIDAGFYNFSKNSEIIVLSGESNGLKIWENDNSRNKTVELFENLTPEIKVRKKVKNNAIKL
ncbi:MAG: hypothetical protein ABH816_03050 [Candidatus Levyibacteriota bacterium]